MCGLVFPAATSSKYLRLIHPKLAPPSPAVLVITRPWSAGASATRDLPPGSLSTTTGVCFFRNATSSSNRLPLPPRDEPAPPLVVQPRMQQHASRTMDRVII